MDCCPESWIGDGYPDCKEQVNFPNTPSPNPSPYPYPNPTTPTLTVSRPGGATSPAMRARPSVPRPSPFSSMVKVPPTAGRQLGSCASSERAWRGSGQLGTPRARPGHRSPLHRLGCLSQPPPKPPIPVRWTNQVQPSDHPCPALAELALAAGKEHVQELKPSAETTNCSELDDRHNWCNKAFRYTSDFSSGADLGLQYCTFDDASGTCSVGETTPCPPEEHAARVYRSKDLNKAEVRARSM